MIYDAVKHLLLYLIKGPAGPPEPPAGSPASVQIFRASKQFLLYKLVALGLVFFFFEFIPIAIAAAVIFDQNSPAEAKLGILLLPAGVLALGVFAYFFTRLEYDMRYYVVTDRSLRIREGVWNITEVTLIYANVQHLEVQQGPIQQLLGIADLIVRTAGGAGSVNSDPIMKMFGIQTNSQQAGQADGHRGVLRGIDNAPEVRDRINALLKQYRHAGLGDPEERRQVSSATARWSPAALQRLREVRDELRAWRLAAAVKPSPPLS